MNKIAIFIEEHEQSVHNVGLELISETRRQVGNTAQICAILLTKRAQTEQIDKINLCGPDSLILVEDDRFAAYDTHYFAHALNEVVSQYHFDILLIGSTLLGRDLAPRLSARLHTGLTADATILEFKVSEEKVTLLATRPALGGNLFATILCPLTLPQMATVRPGVFAISEYQDSKPEIIKFNVSPCSPSKIKVVNRHQIVKSSADLTKANIIIAGGRGVATHFAEIKQVADLVGGEVAASRAVIDANVQAKDRLVGQTGANVKPAVYVAFGISGAIQHVTGMDKSELIIAINNDPNALIFNVANVPLITDAHKVLPLVIKKLETIAKVRI